MPQTEDHTMKAVHLLGLLTLAVALFAAGCGGTSDSKRTAGPDGGTQAESTQAKANLAKLGTEDRKLAEAQKVCPVTGEPLGEMGTPVKIEVGGQPVFLCCDMCEKKARADPGKTLAKVRESQAKSAAGSK
jgi:hypothetical protein